MPNYFIWICPECGEQCDPNGCPEHRAHMAINVVIPERALTDEMLERAWKRFWEQWRYKRGDGTIDQRLQQKEAILAAGPWSGVRPLDREKAQQTILEVLEQDEEWLAGVTADHIVDALIKMQEKHL